MIKKILLIVFLITLAGCSRNVLLEKPDDNLPEYGFNSEDIRSIDNIFRNLKYTPSIAPDKRYVSIITYHSKDYFISEFIIEKNGTVDLTMPKDSHFIVSLPANRTIAYTWNIKNNIDCSVIKLEDRTWIEIPLPESEKGKVGVSLDRQNFYFKPLKEGNEKISLRYEHQTEQREDFFEITFNVKILN